MGKAPIVKNFWLKELATNQIVCIFHVPTTEEQLQSWLVGVGVPMTDISTKLHFINPYVRRQTGDQKADLSSILSEMKEILNTPLNLNIANDVAPQPNKIDENVVSNKKKNMTIIVDSLNHLIALFGLKDVEAFIADVYFTSKMYALTGICALTLPSLDMDQYERLNRSFDAILEMAFKRGDGISNKSNENVVNLWSCSKPKVDRF